MVEPQLFIIASVICGGRIISGSAGTRFWVHRLGYVAVSSPQCCSTFYSSYIRWRSCRKTLP